MLTKEIFHQKKYYPVLVRTIDSISDAEYYKIERAIRDSNSGLYNSNIWLDESADRNGDYYQIRIDDDLEGEGEGLYNPEYDTVIKRLYDLADDWEFNEVE